MRMTRPTPSIMPLMAIPLVRWVLRSLSEVDRGDVESFIGYATIVDVFDLLGVVLAFLGAAQFAAEAMAPDGNDGGVDHEEVNDAEAEQHARNALAVRDVGGAVGEEADASDDDPAGMEKLLARGNAQPVDRGHRCALQHLRHADADRPFRSAERHIDCSLSC